MPVEIIIGIGIGLVIILVFSVLRFMSSPKEVEMNPYANPAPKQSPESRQTEMSGFDESAPVDNPEFSFTVEDIFNIKGRGLVVTGRVASGTIRRGQRVRLSSPNGSSTLETTVMEIESFRKKQASAQAGDNVGLLLAKLSKEQVKKGMSISRI